MSRVLVVGNGMVGLRFVQDLLERDRDRRLQITVVGEEKGGAYNRILLSNVLAGATKASDIELANEQWYEANGVRLLSGRAVIELDRLSHKVILDDGTSLRYDSLVLATGSDALAPPIPGLHRDGRMLAGAVLFRTLDDCAEIGRRAESSRRAIVVGGGLLGLEAARGLAGRGVPVTVVQRGDRLMEQQLDLGASAVLVRTLRGMGIEIVTDAVVAAVVGDGAVSGLSLDDGTELEGDLLVLCCGVRPRTELARDAGIAVGRGVLVDDQLRCISDRDVFAIGECAEHRGHAYGLVAPGWEQARVAAEVIAGGVAAYEGSLVITRLKAAGVELAAMGEPCADDDDDIRFVDGGRGIYQKLIVRDGRLVGAILLGDTRTAGTITQLFDRGAPLPADRASVLMVRRNASTAAAASPTALPGRATICHCNGVTKAAICDAWQDGARTVSDVAGRTRATTGCGTCSDSVEGIVDWLARSDPDAVVVVDEPVLYPAVRA
jgi:assimilatory nitrate reductase electron transfer subunit